MSGDVVASYELFKVPPRWLFLRVETQRGVVGWGEPNVEGFSDTVRTAVEELMRSVVGQDPSRIQYIWQKLFRQKFYGGGPILMSAMAGIDQACGTSRAKL
ncbi:mandelate racemase/muconate lactonizing enzyme [Aureococcus anophagefferens]|nr:mandelate racemase/muconate lactonizing enzyme [Aureococcus anophagefferens]